MEILGGMSEVDRRTALGRIWSLCCKVTAGGTKEGKFVREDLN